MDHTLCFISPPIITTYLSKGVSSSNVKSLVLLHYTIPQYFRCVRFHDPYVPVLPS